MFFKCTSLFLVFHVFVFCESGFVDTLTKCELADTTCIKTLLQKVLKEHAKSGIPEIDLPSIDPLNVKNVTIKVQDLIEFSLMDVYVNGVKDCIIDNFEASVEDERGFIELTCDATIRGKYKAFSAYPLIKTVLNGDTIHGEGNGQAKIKKLKLKLDFAFYIQKRNGELYIKPIFDKTKYDFDVGKMTFMADKIYIGQVESSKFVVNAMNENWRLLLPTFGKPLMDRTITFVYTFVQKFFDGIPIKHFITDDLSAYARE